MLALNQIMGETTFVMKNNLTNCPAKNLRADLKANGHNARRVSVRYNGSLYLTIRQRGLSSDAAESIANKFESVSRCEASGEILSGGNTFVFTNYADKLVDEVAAEIEEEVAAVFKELESYDVHTGNTFTIAGVKVRIMKDLHNFVAERTDDHQRYYVSNGYEAKALAKLILDAQ